MPKLNGPETLPARPAPCTFTLDREMLRCRDGLRPRLPRSERILYGEAEVTLRDAAALLRLQREIDREAAGQAAGTTAQWQAALREVLWAARRHLGERWEPFVADIRANRQLAAVWGLRGEAGLARQGSPAQDRASR